MEFMHRKQEISPGYSSRGHTEPTRWLKSIAGLRTWTHAASLLLATIVLTGILSGSLIAQGTTMGDPNGNECNDRGFVDGDGTSGFPYEISNWNHLNEVRNCEGSHFRLVSDLDSESDGYDEVASKTANEGKGWEPIAWAQANDTTVFDGNDRTIADLVIARDGNDDAANVGLFATLASNHVVNQLTLKYFNVAGRSLTGTLAGSSDGEIFRVSVIDSEVTGDGGRVGGLLGVMNDGTVSESFFRGDVTAQGSLAGGLIGDMSINSTAEKGTVVRSFSDANVEGFDFVGGFTGQLRRGTIRDSYALGSATATTGSARAAGFARSVTDGGTVKTSFAAVSLNGDVAKGFVDQRTNSNLINNLWDADVARTDSDSFSGFRASSQYEMRDRAFFEETGSQQDTDNPWDFDESTGAWTILDIEQDGFVSYPYLRSINYDDPQQPGDNPIGGLKTFSQGSGTENDPIVITGWDELSLLPYAGTLHVALGGDLNASSPGYSEFIQDNGTLANDQTGWIPVGGSLILDGSTVPFRGTFDGQNHTISDLIIDREEFDNQALFAATRDAEIHSLSLDEVSITGSSRTAALVGRAERTQIRDVSVTGDIVGGSRSGGLAGVMEIDDSGTRNTFDLSNLSFDGTIDGVSRTAGLFGVLEIDFEHETEQGSSDLTVTISNAHVKGTVMSPSSSQTGGLIGLLEFDDISNASNQVTLTITGSVVESTVSSGSRSAGGLIGEVSFDNIDGDDVAVHLAIDNSRSEGDVSASSRQAGGLIGYLDMDDVDGANTSVLVEITNSHSKGNVTTENRHAGGLIGYVEFDDVEINSEARLHIKDSYAEGNVTAADENAGGLIGYLELDSSQDEGTIEVLIEDSYALGLVVAEEHAGGLIGFTEIGTRNNSTSIVTISGSYALGDVRSRDENQEDADYAGGLVGRIFVDPRDASEVEVMISGSYARGDVFGAGKVAGVIGSAEIDATRDGNAAKVTIAVSESFASGSVTASADYAGGLTGLADLQAAAGGTANIQVINSYSIATVNGPNHVGGLFGGVDAEAVVLTKASPSIAGAAASLLIENSYAAGSLQAGDNAGGLIGTGTEAETFITVNNSFWDLKTTGVAESAGGQGRATSTLKRPGTFTDAGWDLEVFAEQTEAPVWYMPAAVTGYTSYPFLSAVAYDDIDPDDEEGNQIPGLQANIVFALHADMGTPPLELSKLRSAGLAGFSEGAFSNVYHPSTGGGVVPEALQEDYAQSSGKAEGVLAEGDWSYEAHEARFKVVPYLFADLGVGSELFSVSLAIFYDPEAADVLDVRAGDFLLQNGPGNEDNVMVFTREEFDERTGEAQLMVDVTSSSGNLSLINNELALVEFDMEILRAGYNEIRVDVIEARRKLEDTAGGPEVSTELIPASGSTGAIRLWPGDFAADANGIRGTIGFTDLTAFSSAYFAEAGHEAYRLRFDIGNADNRLYTALPVADGRIGFDDLNIFALGFGLSNRQDSPLLRQTAGPQSGEAIDLIVEAPRVQGGLVRYPVYVDGSVHDVRTMSLNLSYTGMTFVGHEVDGGLDTEMTFSASRSTGGLIEWDSAIIGAQNESIGQAGRIGYLVFEADRPGALSVQSVRARDSQGEPIDTRPVDAAREDQALVPDVFALQQNYPNPFNPSTTIAYDLPVNADVILEVYDVMGRKVATLVNAQQPAGSHQISFDASRLASGAYIYRLRAGEFTQTRQMMLVK